MTKTEAGYRIPEDCCAYCKYSSIGTYDDILCLKISGASITEGGVCNLYEKGIEAHTIPDVIVEPPWVKNSSCDGCAYQHGETCLMTGKHAEARCNKYERETDNAPTEHVIAIDNTAIDELVDIADAMDELELEQEQADERSCENCAFSFVNIDGVAWCKLHDAELDTDDMAPCDGYALSGSVVIISNCNTCCYSYYNDTGQPTCSVSGAVITETEGTCHAYSEAEIEPVPEVDDSIMRICAHCDHSYLREGTNEPWCRLLVMDITDRVNERLGCMQFEKGGQDAI